MLGKWVITLIFLFLPLEMVCSFSGLISDHLGQTRPDGGCALGLFILLICPTARPFLGFGKHLWRLGYKWRRVLGAVPLVLLQFSAVSVLPDTTPVAFESSFPRRPSWLVSALSQVPGLLPSPQAQLDPAGIRLPSGASSATPSFFGFLSPPHSPHPAL